MKICDAHNDFLTKLNSKEISNFLLKSKTYGVNNVFASVFTTEIDQDVITKIGYYKKVLDQIRIKPKCLLHIEDCGFIKSTLDANKVVKLEPFSAGLTWNGLNSLAGGATSTGGLTELGKQVVNIFENSNIIIDLAHLNERSFYDVLKVCNKKIFCSHTAFFDLCENSRNLKKNQINEIIKAGGIIGLTFVGQFLNSRKVASFEDIYRQINYFLVNFDENFLCIGSDFYGTDNLPIGLNCYADFEKLYCYLNNKGISKKTLNKIFYLNLDKFIKK